MSLSFFALLELVLAGEAGDCGAAAVVGDDCGLFSSASLRL